MLDSTGRVDFSKSLNSLENFKNWENLSVSENPDDQKDFDFDSENSSLASSSCWSEGDPLENSKRNNLIEYYPDNVPEG